MKRYFSVEQQNNEDCLFGKDWRSNTYTVGVEKTDLPEVLPIKIRVLNTFNFAEPIISENNECLQLESVRVNNVATLSVPRPSSPEWSSR